MLKVIYKKSTKQDQVEALADHLLKKWSKKKIGTANANKSLSVAHKQTDEKQAIIELSKRFVANFYRRMEKKSAGKPSDKNKTKEK